MTDSCPKCSSSNICPIIYGYPGDEEEFLKQVAEKKIVPGGCVINKKNPTWHCNDCLHQWGPFYHSNKIDSFDYDQGFNIGEVYDQ